MDNNTAPEAETSPTIDIEVVPIDERNNASESETDEPISLANQFKPSAMGLTIKCKKKTGIALTINIKSAWYEAMPGQMPKKLRNEQSEIIESTFLSDYYVRRPIYIDPITIDLSNINGRMILERVIFSHNNSDWLQLKVIDRSLQEDIINGDITLTFTIINIRRGDSNANALFQNEIMVTAPEDGVIISYKEKNHVDNEEIDELNLLYRKKKMFGIGHGCAVNWEDSDRESVREVRTNVLPVYQLPLIEAPATDNLDLAMYNLSDLCSDEIWNTTGMKLLKDLSINYSQWIVDIENEARGWTEDNSRYKSAAFKNIEKCKQNLKRLQKGIDLLTINPDAKVVKCFRLMNRAMLWQQQRSKTKQRKWARKAAQVNLSPIEGNVSIHASLIEFHEQNKGRWRPFQLAFVLMNIEAIWNETSEGRSVVDLIWFPTGGGKTEAYLGLSAFDIFTRRIRAVNDHYNFAKYGGTSILMRYTLRLLTSQQFERASSLICACEIIRKENSALFGNEKISIGLWVGGSSTPNDNSNAIQQFDRLMDSNAAEYNFIVMKCPCCGAQIGKLDSANSRNNRIRGLEKTGNGNDQRVIFRCANQDCDSNVRNWNELPLYVVDEDIFKFKPTLVIGTVDKFAMLTWKAGKETTQADRRNEYDKLQASTLFGFRYNEQSDQISRIMPPELIIQDELHLIAGPLGTMVGLYETLVQTLCNNYGRLTAPFIEMGSPFVPPKIIASSATISRAADQIQSLYGVQKDKLNIFPPQGIEFGETWFSKVNLQKPGRKYLGILAPGYKSIQTAEARIYAKLLQTIKSGDFDPAEKDYYWTIVGYFNSIRGLGSASTLINSDIEQYLRGTIWSRELTTNDLKRRYYRHMELTSRMSDSEIPKILKELETSYDPSNERNALSICLATNMIATGVDVSRLGLMVVHGQPKTTAEYIQASSRVGRDTRQYGDDLSKFIGQGLAVTIYSPNKPRDKSHYEQFQSYHGRIYANVEPTSVTPFSVNARDKALHSVFIGLIRHFSDGQLRARPDGYSGGDAWLQYTNIFKRIILDRCDIVDPVESARVESTLDELIMKWRDSGIQKYGDAGNMAIRNNPDTRVLMYAPTAEVPTGYILPGDYFSKSVNTSMRGVDSESKLEINRV